MKKLYKSIVLLSVFVLIMTSCSEEPELAQDPFVAAFEQISISLQNISNDKEIVVVYSDTAIENGFVTIEVTDNLAVFGVDYETVPALDEGLLTLPITSGEVQTTFIFKKLNTNLVGETVFVHFNIIDIEHTNSNIQGNSQLVINSSASLGGSFLPEVGGPNQGNQVFIDLSAQKSTVVQRDTWDLGFYCGDEFRVALNGSIFMATKATTYTDIDAVPESVLTAMQSEVTTSNGDVNNANYVDSIDGDILGTAIDEISVNDDDNKVYLLNMGYKIGMYTPNVGSVDIQGAFRGWKKIKIIKNGDGYIMQYANLEDTTHQEISITKDNMYNFKHFSFDTLSTVDIEPKKENWDLCFAPFTYVILNPPHGSYIFSDFIVHNRKGDAVSYRQMITSELNYDNFEYSDIDESNFSEDQTTIGSNWRNVFTRMVRDDRFFILKDPNGNMYKIKFLAMVNADGERGFPQFEYAILEQ